LIVNSAFSALSARIIALRIENPYSILRQIANLPQPMVIRVNKNPALACPNLSAFSAISARVFPSFGLHFRFFSVFLHFIMS
jgi:hypothetical protein